MLQIKSQHLTWGGTKETIIPKNIRSKTVFVNKMK